MNQQITPDNLRDAQWMVPKIIEELGVACGLIREAVYDTEQDRAANAVHAAQDALDALNTAERLVADMAVELAKWIEYVNQETETR